jgi:hypothetical protein
MLILVVAKAGAYPQIPWKRSPLAPHSSLCFRWQMRFNAPIGWDVHSGFGGCDHSGRGRRACIIHGIPPFARLFDRLRAEAEVRQYAQTAFFVLDVFQKGNASAAAVRPIRPGVRAQVDLREEAAAQGAG